MEPSIKMMHVKSNDISIRIQGKDLNMYVDKLRLKQVITNLISNSLKYTKEGCIEVIVFQMELVGSYVNRTGIGLCLCRFLVEQMHGWHHIFR